MGKSKYILRKTTRKSKKYNKKLRTYSKFKVNYQLENYLLLGIDKKKKLQLLLKLE